MSDQKVVKNPVSKAEWAERNRIIEEMKRAQPARPASPRLLQHFAATFNEKKGHNLRAR